MRWEINDFKWHSFPTEPIVSTHALRLHTCPTRTVANYSAPIASIQARLFMELTVSVTASYVHLT